MSTARLRSHSGTMVTQAPLCESPANLRPRREDRSRFRGRYVWESSPPLARRGLGDAGQLVHGPRRISARTEKIVARLPAWRPPPTHLRSRGEDSNRPRQARSYSGSPPLARRRRRATGRRTRTGRLTSACAEKTPRRRRCRCRAAAHLRSREEDKYTPRNPRSPYGSPPLARRGLGHPLCRWSRHGSPPLARRDLPVARSLPLLVRLASARAERTPGRSPRSSC